MVIQREVTVVKMFMQALTILYQSLVVTVLQYIVQYIVNILSLQTCNQTCPDFKIGTICKCILPQRFKYYTKEQQQTLPLCSDTEEGKSILNLITKENHVELKTYVSMRDKAPYIYFLCNFRSSINHMMKSDTMM